MLTLIVVHNPCHEGNPSDIIDDTRFVTRGILTFAVTPRPQRSLGSKFSATVARGLLNVCDENEMSPSVITTITAVQ